MKKKGYKEVEVDLTDDEFMFLANLAHERDITLNQLCNDILRDYINKEENK